MLLGGAAQAADLPVKAVPVPVAYSTTWQGFYVDGYFQDGGNITHADSTVGTASFDLASIPHGPGIGGSIGWNYELSKSLVIGARADISWLNMSDSGQIANGALNFSNATNYLGNLDVLVGLPLSVDRRLLAYGVGGFAFGGAKPNLQVGTLQQAASDTSTGWNLGAGLRYKLDDHLQVWIEGDYYQLGDKSLSLVDSTGAVIATSTAKYHIITQKLGLGWQF